MTRGILPFEVELAERSDTVTGRAGLPLVVETMRALGLDQAISQQLRIRARASGYSELEKIEALVLLMARTRSSAFIPGDSWTHSSAAICGSFSRN